MSVKLPFCEETINPFSKFSISSTRTNDTSLHFVFTLMTNGGLASGKIYIHLKKRLNPGVTPRDPCRDWLILCHVPLGH